MYAMASSNQKIAVTLLDELPTDIRIITYINGILTVNEIEYVGEKELLDKYVDLAMKYKFGYVPTNIK